MKWMSWKTKLKSPAGSIKSCSRRWMMPRKHQQSANQLKHGYTKRWTAPPTAMPVFPSLPQERNRFAASSNPGCKALKLLRRFILRRTGWRHSIFAFRSFCSLRGAHTLRVGDGWRPSTGVSLADPADQDPDSPPWFSVAQRVALQSLFRSEGLARQPQAGAGGSPERIGSIHLGFRDLPIELLEGSAPRSR